MARESLSAKTFVGTQVNPVSANKATWRSPSGGTWCKKVMIIYQQLGTVKAKRSHSMEKRQIQSRNKFMRQ